MKQISTVLMVVAALTASGCVMSPEAQSTAINECHEHKLNAVVVVQKGTNKVRRVYCHPNAAENIAVVESSLDKGEVNE